MASYLQPTVHTPYLTMLSTLCLTVLYTLTSNIIHINTENIDLGLETQLAGSRRPWFQVYFPVPNKLGVCCRHVIPALGRERQEDQKFPAT